MTSAAKRDEMVRLLRQRVLAHLQLGLLKPGDRMPGARELAREFNTDPRAIISAFRTLQRESIVELRTRSGVYVAASVQTQSAHQQGDWLATVLQEALRHGVKVPDFAGHVARAVETLRLRAVVIDCNDDQLFATSEELEYTYGFEVATMKLVDVGGSRLSPLVRNANLLVTTQMHEDAVALIAKRAGCPYVAVEMHAELLAEVGRMMEHDTVYFVVTDVVFAEKLRYILEGVGTTDNLHLMVLGRDDIAAIPFAAPVYVSSLARRRLLEGGRPEDAWLCQDRSEQHVFSDNSSGKLLTFITRANLSAGQSPRMGL